MYVCTCINWPCELSLENHEKPKLVHVPWGGSTVPHQVERSGYVRVTVVTAKIVLCVCVCVCVWCVLQNSHSSLTILWLYSSDAWWTALSQADSSALEGDNLQYLNVQPAFSEREYRYPRLPPYLHNTSGYVKEQCIYVCTSTQCSFALATT